MADAPPVRAKCPPSPQGLRLFLRQTPVSTGSRRGLPPGPPMPLRPSTSHESLPAAPPVHRRHAAPFFFHVSAACRAQPCRDAGKTPPSGKPPPRNAAASAPAAGRRRAPARPSRETLHHGAAVKKRKSGKIFLPGTGTAQPEEENCPPFPFIPGGLPHVHRGKAALFKRNGYSSPNSYCSSLSSTAERIMAMTAETMAAVPWGTSSTFLPRRRSKNTAGHSCVFVLTMGST